MYMMQSQLPENAIYMPQNESFSGMITPLPEEGLEQYRGTLCGPISLSLPENWYGK